jgi:alkylation response protein AidB-like acyl-CoA dehydrogenase
VWTTNGQHADVGYLLARTDPSAPKHKGITAFALDMRLAGVDVRPLREITGTYDFNEVFLDSVRVPVDAVIGQVNDGWRVANSSLAHERTGVAAISVELEATLDDLVELAGPQLSNGAVRREVGRVATHVKVIGLMSAAAQSAMLAGRVDIADAPLTKIFFSDTNLALTELGMRLQGESAVVVEGDSGAVADGWWQDAYLYARAYTIAGGANEVLKNVVAERGIGLPRDPS